MTAYPLEGCLSWNMNTLCNYRCSYCTQRFLDDRKAWARDLPAFLEAFRRLPGQWELKLSGGEPFQHPDFLGVVGRLIEQGRRVAVVPNFPATPSTLERYVALTAPRPGVFSASLHLEYVSPDTFLEKLAWFKGIYGGPVVATCVATPAQLPRLPALQEQYQKAGISLKIQPQKEDRDVIDYSESEELQLRALGGHNGTGRVEASFRGRPCWAGARYLVVDHRGEAWRCYPARRARSERLGNLLDGSFRLRMEAAPCLYEFCSCTVPFQRGMVEGGRDVRG
ncbi:MAG TPA: radical SAM protein [Myxococcota bacterium]|nr:radical SAM protein [Myxococcota bacterium]